MVKWSLRGLRIHTPWVRIPVRAGGRVFETHAQWAGGRRFRIFQWAGKVGVEFLSSKTGWAGPGARARPALSVVLLAATLG